jgi:hypothetical protein
MDTENKPILSKTSEMKIGKVTYIVTARYKESGRETAEQKLLRYVSARVSDELKSTKNAVN